MNNQQHINSLIAGFASAVLYLLSISGVIVGIFVIALPFLPLLWTSFRHGSNSALISLLSASFIVLVAGGANAFFVYVCLLAAPAWIFGYYMMRVKLIESGDFKEFRWLPVGMVIICSCVYFAFIFTASAAMVQIFSDVSMLELLRKETAQTSKMMEPAVGELLSSIVEEMPYIIIAAFIWCWMFLLYAASIIAHFECFTRGKTPRPSVKNTSFTPPVWLPGLLLLAAIVSQSPSKDVNFIAISCFFILLLPYFFSGLAEIQRYIAGTNNARILNILFYLVLIIGQWPILAIVTAIGIYRHITAFSEKSVT